MCLYFDGLLTVFGGWFNPSLCSVHQGAGGDGIPGLSWDGQSANVCLSDVTDWIDLLSVPTTWRSFSVLIVLSHSLHLAALFGLSVSLAPAS